MGYDPDIHHRRSIRLKGYDYSSDGVYFITICVNKWRCIFGNVINGKMELNEYGKIANEFWPQIPIHFKNTKIDYFVTMPNHIHAIIIITDACTGGVTPPRTRRGGGTPPIHEPVEGGETPPIHEPVEGGETPPIHQLVEGGVTPPRTRRGGGTPPIHQPVEGGETPPIHQLVEGGGTPPIPLRTGGVTPPQRNPSLAEIIAYYKYQTTKFINEINKTPGKRVWHRNYYERIIRDEMEWYYTEEYIINNPINWHDDDENPDGK